MNPASVSKRVVVYFYEFRNGRRFYRFVPSKYDGKRHKMITAKKKIASTNPKDLELGILLKKTFMQCETK